MPLVESAAPYDQSARRVNAALRAYSTADGYGSANFTGVHTPRRTARRAAASPACVSLSLTPMTEHRLAI